MKKRNKYYIRDKEYKSLCKKLCDNQQAQRDLGWIELETPIFIGYRAKLEPRQDIQNRDDAWVFWDICNSLSTTEFARKIDQFHWNVKKKRNQFVDMRRPHIKGISESVYNSIPPQIQKYFKLDEHYSRYPYYYCDVPNFYWEIVYEKEYRTKVRRIDSDLKREESEIRRRIDFDFYNENNHMSGSPSWFRRRLNKSQKAKSKQTLYNIMYNGDEDATFEDNYKSASWLWW